MTTRRTAAVRLIASLRRWRPGPDGVAAAAAAAGDPTSLLDLDQLTRGGQASARQHASGESAWNHRTSWRHGIAAPIRAFLGTEASGAVMLVGAIVLALVWTNSPWSGSYGTFWATRISVDVGQHAVGTDLRGAVNEGLMTLFFLVVGLEAKRELDLGELRDRRRLTVPVLAGIGGMVASILVYLAVTSARGGAGGWGVALSTDTALALGTLTLTTRNHGNRLRVFLLTVLVIDDVAALSVIALVYPDQIDLGALATAIVLLAVLIGLRWYGIRRRDAQDAGIALFAVSVLVGFGLWLALFESGIDPVISGLLIGLLTSARQPQRARVERGSTLTRSFRARPTPELAYEASANLTGAISPNDRLQYRLHPWTSRVIVPIFALANAGLHLDDRLLSGAVVSPVTWAIVLAYTIGKPVGILATAWITAKGAPRAGKLPVGWRQLAGTASSAGVGFTVSLLIASRAFTGGELNQAKLGVLATALVSPLIAAGCFGPLRRTMRDRSRQPEARENTPADLADEVDPARDHIRGARDAPITLLAYGSFGCRYCAAAASVVPALLDRFGDRVRFVYRHLPLGDAEADAQLAAEAAEAAGEQNAFWSMHDRLSTDPERISLDDVYRDARDLGLDLDRFFAVLGRHAHAGKIADDVRGADASGVSGTPAFFINGHRYCGSFDLDTLTAELVAAMPAVTEGPPPPRTAVAG
jgi:Na+/H+ antiporter NhaA